jgi:hypothetical protein
MTSSDIPKVDVMAFLGIHRATPIAKAKRCLEIGIKQKGNTLLEKEKIISTEDTAALDNSYSNFLKSMQNNDDYLT